MSEDFHRRIARGAAWAAAAAWARIVLSLLAFAVIARLIGPQSYGTGTLAAALVALCQVFVGPAAGEVLVQQTRLDARALAAWFWLLQGLALAACLALCALREPLAALCGEPRAAALLAAYALLLPLTALQTVPEALLGRELRFRVQALAGGAGSLAGSAAGVALALRGAGPWALVGLQLVQAAVQTMLLWRGAAFRPAAAPDWRALAPLARYSGGSVGVRLVNELDGQLPKLLIGALLGSTALGWYAVARRIFDLLKDLLIVPLNTVALPSLAQARAQGHAVPALFAAALRTSTAIANPAFLGLAAIAPLLVPLLFGPHWAPAAPLLQLTALIGLRTSVNSFNGAALRAYGQPLRQLGLGLAGIVLLLLLLPAAAPLGLAAMTAATVLRAYATWPLAAGLVARLGACPVRVQFTAGLHSLAAALAMAALVTLWRLGPGAALAPAALLASCVVLGVLGYVAALALVAPAELRAVLGVARRLRGGRQPTPAPGATPAAASGVGQ